MAVRSARDTFVLRLKLVALKVFFALFLLLGVLSAAFYHFFLSAEDLEVPKLESGWWGRGDRSNYKEDPSIRKFSVSVSNKTLNDLHQRLKSTLYPEPLEGATFEYGFNSNYLRQVVDYWLTKYDWKAQEARINSFPHFKTQIEGIDVHFLHVKPKSVPSGVNVRPLILVHGWPGSFVEFLDIIPLLTTPRAGLDFVFEVIVPSIPGYGFSEASHQTGFGQVETAQLFDKLMQRLGFESYYSQGGDWGSVVVTDMAILFPERVKGVHVNVVFSNSGSFWIKWFLGHFFPFAVVSPKDFKKLYPLGEKLPMILQETGYMHLQATKPDTIGLALSNTPAGLASYILEKFSTWTEPKGKSEKDGFLLKKFNLDQLLTNVMVYWVTGSITSSVRYYKEHFSSSQMAYKMERMQVKIPSAVAAFPNELFMVPENMVGGRFVQLLFYTDMPRGGHFAAFEEPQLLADEVWKFVTKVEQLPPPQKNEKKN